MAIFTHNKEITEVYTQNRVIATIYKGSKILWEAVRSCFGSGMWLINKPWLYKEGWRESK